MEAINKHPEHLSRGLIDSTNAALSIARTTTADFNTPPMQLFMRALKKCNENYVQIDNNEILYSDFFDLNTGTFRLDCTVSSLSDSDMSAFTPLKHVNGHLSIQNPNITSLDGLCNLEMVSGDLVLSRSGIKHLDALNKLKTVNSIMLDLMPDLFDINGFNSLQIIKNRLQISHNPKLTVINGFNSVTSITSSLQIKNNPQLATIAGLNSLQEITQGSLMINDNKAIKHIYGFNSLKSLGDALEVNRCTQLNDFGFLSKLENVANILISDTGLTDGSPLRKVFEHQPIFPGCIKIVSNNLKSVTFLRGLKSVGSSFYLHQNKLTNLEGLEALDSVGASFSLAANQLNDISQLASLDSINGILSLTNNRLTSLHGLENLRRLKTARWSGEWLTIKLYGNKQQDGRYSLTDISALSNITTDDKHIIIHTDDNHKHRILPDKNSLFFTNRIEVFAKCSQGFKQTPILSADNSEPPKKLNSLDRQVLETLILPGYAGRPEIRRVLFVGCAEFTKFYESYFAVQDYYTIEINPARAQYGATKPGHHFVDSVDNIDCHFRPSSLDLIIINGVFGWGLNQRSQAENVIDKFYELLSAQGSLMIGWNDLSEYTPFIPNELSGLRRFDRVAFPGMEIFKFVQRLSNGDYLVKDKWQHIFSFYTKKQIREKMNYVEMASTL